jgi:hypothetical protein
VDGSGDKVNAAGFSDSAIDRTVDGITYDALPKPALNTSIPPLPVRVSLPAPATNASGCSVSSAGDVNGDGLDDLIVGAMYADPNGNSSGHWRLSCHYNHPLPRH